MGRLSHSWHLTKASMRVLRQDKELLWMPVLSALASLVAVAAIAGVGFAGGVLPETQDAEGNVKPLGVVLAFAMYVILAFIALFFNAAVVAGATERLRGGDPTVGSALSKAWSKAGKLFLWSLVVATVNVILQAIRERSGFLGRMLASIAGMAWNLATYFMVPILVFEDEGIGRSVRRSGGLFRKTWGETVVGEAGIGLAATVVTFVTVLVGVFLVVALSALGPVGMILGIAILVAAVLTVVVLFATLGGVYKAALYQFATTGQSAAAFTPADLQGQFHAR